jgi:zinc protease
MSWFVHRFARIALCAWGMLLMIASVSFAQDVHEYQLDNGLKVLLKENHNAPVINLQVAYRVGSKYENSGETGISHLIEHMMFKTTKNLPLGEFDKRLKAVGADNNAYTWLDQTVYHETIAADKVDVALALEAERMVNLSCLPEDHQFEMTVVRNELEQRDDSPFTLLYEEFMSAAFKAHPYKSPTIGWKDDVESITTQDISDYYHHYYHPDNAFIAAVGDFDPDALFAKIKQYFGSIPSGHVVLPRLSKEPQQIGERRFEIRRVGQMDFILTGWHIPASTDPDAYALEVLGNVLGSGRTSRLYKALVDTGKCAQASAWSSAFGYVDPFLFMTMAAVSPGVDPAEVEPVFYEQIDSIIKDGVTKAELDRAKKQARVSFVYSKDAVEQEADALVSFELAGSWRKIDEYLPGIEAVTTEDVQRVAAKYLVQENRTCGFYRAIRPEGAPAEGDEMGEGIPGPAGDDEMPNLDALRPQYRRSGEDATLQLAASLPAPQSPTVAVADSAPYATTQKLAADSAPYATTQKLANGIVVIVRENHNNSTVNIKGLVCAGRIDDPAAKPGVASMAVSLLSSGTSKHNKQQLAEIMEDSGMEMGFGASRENFSFSGRSLNEDFSKLLETIAEQLRDSTFPQEEVELTRQQTLAGLLSSFDSTFDTSFYTGRDLLYGKGNPFAGRVEGTQASVQTITRDDLLAWYKANVVPDKAVIAIVGDVDTVEALKLVEQYFGTWTGTNPQHEARIALGSQFQTTGGKREVVAMPDKSSASLTWLGPGPSKLGDDWAPRTIASFIFGGDFSSRMNERLRIKEGLTYGAFAWFSNGRAAGPFCVSADVNPENIEPAVTAATEEMARYASAGATADELALAKNYLTGNYPVKLATNGDVAAALADALYLDRDATFIQHYAEGINAVSLEQVNAVAAKYVDPAKLMLIVAGTVTPEKPAH